MRFKRALVGAFSDAVRLDGGRSLVRPLAAAASSELRHRLRDDMRSLRQAVRSGETVISGFFPVSTEDLTKRIMEGRRRERHLAGFALNPAAGPFRTPLAAWFDACYNYDSGMPDQRPWDARYAEHVSEGVRVVDPSEPFRQADASVRQAEDARRRGHMSLLRIPLRDAGFVAVSTWERGHSLLIMSPDERVLAVTDVSIARAVSHDARGLGLGAALGAMQMLLMPGEGRSMGYSYTPAGLASRLAAIDLVRDVALAIGEEPGDPGPRPFVEDGVVRFPDVDRGITP